MPSHLNSTWADKIFLNSEKVDIIGSWYWLTWLYKTILIKILSLDSIPGSWQYTWFWLVRFEGNCEIRHIHWSTHLLLLEQ